MSQILLCNLSYMYKPNKFMVWSSNIANKKWCLLYNIRLQNLACPIYVFLFTDSVNKAENFCSVNINPRNTNIISICITPVAHLHQKTYDSFQRQGYCRVTLYIAKLLTVKYVKKKKNNEAAEQGSWNRKFWSTQVDLNTYIRLFRTRSSHIFNQIIGS